MKSPGGSNRRTKSGASPCPEWRAGFAFQKSTFQTGSFPSPSPGRFFFRLESFLTFSFPGMHRTVRTTDMLPFPLSVCTSISWSADSYREGRTDGRTDGQADRHRHFPLIGFSKRRRGVASPSPKKVSGPIHSRLWGTRAYLAGLRLP